LAGEALATLKDGGDRYNRNQEQDAREQLVSQQDVAEALGINKTLISNARMLKEKAEPNVIEMVRNGRVGIKNEFWRTTLSIWHRSPR